MQLEFFGENFDRIKCSKTCDNCRSGKEAEHRDVTDVAKEILSLLDSILKQRRAGATMMQLAELYRGSKSKSATKGLTIAQIKGYGSGSKFKKGELDRIMHTMIFERLLTETSVENNVGFLADYVNHGDNSQGLLDGQRRLLVEFPRAGTASKENKEAPPSAKTGKATDGATKNKSRKRAPSSHSPVGKASEPQDGLEFDGVGGLSDHDDATTDMSGENAKLAAPAILPHEATKQLVEKIKQLTKYWADEEQNLGKKVFCKCRCLSSPVDYSRLVCVSHYKLLKTGIFCRPMWSRLLPNRCLQR
jgi:superfamily II DNA helicase RecQ